MNNSVVTIEQLEQVGEAASFLHLLGDEIEFKQLNFCYPANVGRWWDALATDKKLQVIAYVRMPPGIEYRPRLNWAAFTSKAKREFSILLKDRIDRAERACRAARQLRASA